MIQIKINKKVLATALVGVALIVSAALVVSLRDNDTSKIVTTPPPADEQPNTTPDTTPDANDDTTPTGDDDEVPVEPEEPGDDDDAGTDEGKTTGLARAIEVHERNIAKMTEKGNTHALKGLQNSLDNLNMNLEKQNQKSEQQEQNGLGKDHGNNSQGQGQEHGQGNGNQNGQT